jgi:ribonucleotide reductase beta subunit family protein with ferritin-like domain
MRDILEEDDSRFSILPLQHQDIYDMYKSAVASFWIAEEVDLSKDVADWNRMAENERFFISHILAFFAGADGVINENLAVRFYNDVKLGEARLFYGFQIAMEGIHQEVYNNIIDTYIKDNNERNKLFHSIKEMPIIKAKADWCKKYINSDEEFQIRLIAFACVEGIQFSGSFCAVFWLKSRNILRGLTFSNELISRDEALHTEFAVLLYHKLPKIKSSIIHRIIKEAVDVEIEFITEALPCRLIGMNSKLMIQYIQFVANRLAVQLGTDKIYPQASNPFSFMEKISIESKTNFFEAKVSEYALATKDITGNEFDFENMEF